jgi:hypothetical protein
MSPVVHHRVVPENALALRILAAHPSKLVLRARMNPLLLSQLADVPHGIGLEWMPIASIVFPAVLLLVIIYLGSRNTV